MTVGKIIEMMSVFQDGVLVQLSYSDSNLNFKIQCKPLANLVNENYQFFYGVFKSCTHTYFEPWAVENDNVVDINVINDLELKFLNIEREAEDYIKIYASCSHKYKGGNWWIKCDDLKIYDEDFQELALIELTELSEKFWFLTKK